jgi:hypothetical protein
MAILAFLLHILNTDGGVTHQVDIRRAFIHQIIENSQL